MVDIRDYQSLDMERGGTFIEKKPIMSQAPIDPNDQAAVQKCFKEFKEMLGLLGLLNDSHNDVLLMRFLRARQYSIPLATKMFTESEEWRKKMNVESLVKDFVFPEDKLVAAIYPRFYVRLTFVDSKYL